LRIGFFTNPSAFTGVAVMVILQMLFTYLPQANFIFRSAPPGWVDWAKILSFALLVYFLVEMEKALRLRSRQKKSKL
jgi:magnesium-transporting ATPase (P-type)